MKQFFHAIPTLSPVRRAAAFFAFLGLLTLASCGEDPDSPAGIMKEQTRIFNEMAAVINSVAEGADQSEAAEKLAALQEELKDLKVKLAGVDNLKEEGREKILDLDHFSKATMAFQEAQRNLVRSGRNTFEFQQALAAHHNPAPMPGEGSTD